jgi:formylglycine-generating enzyme required for sulfatase activity
MPILQFGLVIILAFSVHGYAYGCATAAHEMVCIQRGSFFRGRLHGRPDEAPRHRVEISEFLIDKFLVTNGDFSKFVKSTKYVTTAEKRGFGMVAVEGMKDWEWKKVPRANWRQPFGPKLGKASRMRNSPVVSVSWEDANAYCRFYGKRLPTEAEWEYAMRAGSDGSRFPWGNSPKDSNGKMRLNFWQGGGHEKNLKEDGYRYLSPVGTYPPNAWGIYDPVGNVWQWVSDWYDSRYYEEVVKENSVIDPPGPKTGKKRVARGGSWWCSYTTCSGFGLNFRGKAAPLAVFNNNGFRCAKSEN